MEACIASSSLLSSPVLQSHLQSTERAYPKNTAFLLLCHRKVSLLLIPLTVESFVKAYQELFNQNRSIGLLGYSFYPPEQGHMQVKNVHWGKRISTEKEQFLPLYCFDCFLRNMSSGKKMERVNLSFMGLLESKAWLMEGSLSSVTFAFLLGITSTSWTFYFVSVVLYSVQRFKVKSPDRNYTTYFHVYLPIYCSPILEEGILGSKAWEISLHLSTRKIASRGRGMPHQVRNWFLCLKGIPEIKRYG